MNKKLTLNIDDQIIVYAHQYAQKTHQSISSMVEKYFIMLKNSEEIQPFSAETTELYGILSDNPLPDIKTMRKAFHEKSID